MNSASSLSDVTVLEVGEGWTTALAGKLLLDLGAHVSKVEVPWGDSLRGFGRDESERQAAFALPNRGKQLVEADILSVHLESGFADFDVLLVDVRSAGRIGIDTTRIGPRTIVCRFSPFDVSGPLAGTAANDLTLQALSGVMATTGWPGGRPLRAGTELSSVMGALYGVVGVNASLIERERSSLGQVVDVSLYDCLVSALTNFASRVLGGVDPLGRLGNQGPNSAPWELFETADDEYVFIIAGSPGTFERLAATMGQPELIADSRFEDPHKRRENYQSITAIVNAWTRTLPRSDVVALLRANGVPVSPVDSIRDLLGEAHLISRGLLTRTPGGDGTPALGIGQPLGFRPGSLAKARLGAVKRREFEPSEYPRQRPLSGVRVVDFGTLTAGPFCTRLLANLGADVLKIEPPNGEPGRHMPPIIDGESVFFHISNNGKHSLRANLHHEGDVAIVAEILARADILISNQAPGALEKRGLDATRLLSDAPGLIYTTVSGYGHEGTLGGLRAYDTVIQAAAGLMSLTGEKDERPIKTGISTADVLGALASAGASLAAYYGRITARHAGVYLDVSLFDICAWSTQMAWVSEQSSLGEVTRQGNSHWLFAPYGVYDTKDNRMVAIACESDEQWRGLAAVLRVGLEELCPDGFESWDRADRWSRRDQLDALLTTYCGTRDLDVVVETMQTRHVPSGEVVAVEEVLTSRQRLAKTTIDAVAEDGRSFTVTDFPIRLSATPGVVTTPAPPLGGEDHRVRNQPDKAWESVFDAEEASTDVHK